MSPIPPGRYNNADPPAAGNARMSNSWKGPSSAVAPDLFDPSGVPSGVVGPAALRHAVCARPFRTRRRAGIAHSPSSAAFVYSTGTDFDRAPWLPHGTGRTRRDADCFLGYRHGPVAAGTGMVVYFARFHVRHGGERIRHEARRIQPRLRPAGRSRQRDMPTENKLGRRSSWCTSGRHPGGTWRSA